MRIEEDTKLDYADVLFRPKRSTLSSRKDVELKRTYKFKYSNHLWSGIPIIAANMDGVGEIEVAKNLAKFEIMTCLTKQHDIKTLKRNSAIKEIHPHLVLSTGTSKEDYKRLNDILKEYIALGTYIYPPKPSMRIITDVFEFCSNEMPRWNTISISGYHIREAGSTAVQEIAFTLANGIAYVQSAIDKGLDVNQFGKRLSFFFNCHNNFFEEVAKFRATRRMWAKIMKERFSATEPKSMMCRFHTQTAGSTLQAQQIDNNVVRTTLQAIAAVLGGTQSLHTNSRDEALSLPTEKSARLALRTQQIIAHESGIPSVADPLAGSHYIEDLTDELEKEAAELIDKIDELGGSVPAIENEFQQNEIAKSAFDYQKAIDDGEKIIVGVNKFQSKEAEIQETLQIDQKAVQRQLDRLQSLKQNRNHQKVESSLKVLNDAASNDKNLMPVIIDAVQSEATLGEISDTLRGVFGEY